MDVEVERGGGERRRRQSLKLYANVLRSSVMGRLSESSEERFMGYVLCTLLKLVERGAGLHRINCSQLKVILSTSNNSSYFIVSRDFFFTKKKIFNFKLILTILLLMLLLKKKKATDAMNLHHIDKWLFSSHMCCTKVSLFIIYLLCTNTYI